MFLLGNNCHVDEEIGAWGVFWVWIVVCVGVCVGEGVQRESEPPLMSSPGHRSPRPSLLFYLFKAAVWALA